MTALWLRREVRHRWRSLLFLLVLTAVCAGVVLTAAAGARRGGTAWDRLEARTLPATVQVVPYGIPVDYAKVRSLPEVMAAGTFADSAFYRIEGDYLPYVAGNPPADDQIMRTVERPVVLAGRMFDPRRPDEAVVTARWVTHYGTGVGDRVTARFYTVKQLRDLQGANPADIRPAGPREPLRIVGVVRSPWFNDGLGYGGSIMASPALIALHPANVQLDGAHRGALVRLRHGDADVPRFQADLARITGHTDITVRPLSEFSHNFRHTTSFDAAWLAAIALAAGVAATWTVGQVLRRHVGGSVQQLRSLVAVGMTGAQVTRAAAVAPALAATGGVLLGVGAAAVASRWFPIGAAVDLEPHPGIDVDPLVLGAGVAFAVVLVVACCALFARFSHRDLARRASTGRRSLTVRAAARAGMPVPVLTGVRFALETGQGRARVPSRSALFGAVVGIAGVLAGFTLVAAVQDAAHTKARFGADWDLWLVMGLGGQTVRPPAQALAVAGRDPDVAGLNDLTVAVGRADGRLPTTLFSYRPADPPLRPVMVSGRLPGGPGETVLAPGVADDLGKGIGDTVRFTGTLERRGTLVQIPATVTGIGFVPDWSDSSYARGVWLSGPAFDQIVTTTYDARMAQVALRPGVDVPAATARLTAALGPLGRPAAGGAAVQPTDPIQEMHDIARVSALPSLLGGFLAVLALAAAAHALVSAAHRRGPELAVLRVLGMTRWQTVSVLVVQGFVLAGVGLVVGAPLGVALGRTAWRVVAAYFPLAYVAPLPVPALLMAVPVTLALVLLLAAWPARRAARMRVADILRAE